MEGRRGDVGVGVGGIRGWGVGDWGGGGGVD